MNEADELLAQACLSAAVNIKHRFEIEGLDIAARIAKMIERHMITTAQLYDTSAARHLYDMAIKERDEVTANLLKMQHDRNYQETRVVGKLSVIDQLRTELAVLKLENDIDLDDDDKDYIRDRLEESV